jgi:outer membrane protein TolC
VNGTGSYVHNFYQVEIPFGTQTITTPPPDTWNVAASASWTPLNVRAIYDYGTSKANVTATELSFDDKRRQIALSLVTAILATLSSTHVAELNRVGLRSALERLHLTEARLEFGQGTPLDVDRANADVAAARRLIIDGDESLRRAREALGLAIGSRDPVGVVGLFDLDAFELAVSRTCRLNDEIESRPDVRAAREHLRIAKRSIESALLSPLPTLGFASTLAYTSSPVLAPNTTFALEAVVTIPFYDGGVRYGQLRDARAQETQAEQVLEQTRLNAIVTAARAKRSVDVARADRDVSKTERDLAQQIDLRTRDAYARGRGTSLDLITSAQALRLAEINLAIIEFQLAEARADAALENAECTF